MNRILKKRVKKRVCKIKEEIDKKTNPKKRRRRSLKTVNSSENLQNKNEKILICLIQPNMLKMKNRQQLLDAISQCMEKNSKSEINENKNDESINESIEENDEKNKELKSKKLKKRKNERRKKNIKNKNNENHEENSNDTTDDLSNNPKKSKNNENPPIVIKDNKDKEEKNRMKRASFKYYIYS